jgi:hypothetical protein
MGRYRLVRCGGLVGSGGLLPRRKLHRRYRLLRGDRLVRGRDRLVRGRLSGRDRLLLRQFPGGIELCSEPVRIVGGRNRWNRGAAFTHWGSSPRSLRPIAAR